MKVQDFTYLLQHPDEVVSTEQTAQLEDVIDEYPYFQAARALHLKGLKNANSFKYNNALKVAAAYTADRDVLFDFITSEEFLQNDIAKTILGNNDEPTENEVDSVDRPTQQMPKKPDSDLEPLSVESKSSDTNTNEQIEKDDVVASLELGRPLAFTKNEKHSFSEWLQLTSLKKQDSGSGHSDKIKKVDDLASDNDSGILPKEENSKKKKFELIDKFLEENPKIIPREGSSSEVDISTSVKLDKNELMTETLAKVYLEQKKYKKAIQAFKILSLKYPEKSGFFADRIRAIEKIRKENPRE
ncbi:hypothetical protein ACEZ3G_08630 [Maribacter algicola]|uniref:Uncharacterized protein n=1 Tax=Meishania litoralis TaxID=3434685 RepID=A0ACC7LKG3_9FLAO